MLADDSAIVLPRRTQPGGFNSLLSCRHACAGHGGNANGMSAHARTHVRCVCVLFASPAVCRTARAEQVVELAFPVTLSFTPLGDGAGPGKRGAGRERAALPAHALPRPPPPIRLTDCLRVLRCAACLYVWLRLCVRVRACMCMPETLRACARTLMPRSSATLFCICSAAAATLSRL